MPVSDDTQPRCFDVMAMDAICGDSKTLDSSEAEIGVIFCGSKSYFCCILENRHLAGPVRP